jgi:hypothetical protein
MHRSMRNTAFQWSSTMAAKPPGPSAQAGFARSVSLMANRRLREIQRSRLRFVRRIDQGACRPLYPIEYQTPGEFPRFAPSPIANDQSYTAIAGGAKACSARLAPRPSTAGLLRDCHSQKPHLGVEYGACGLSSEAARKAIFPVSHDNRRAMDYAKRKLR